MMRKFRNKQEAADYLVDTLNCIPSGLILDAWKYEMAKESVSRNDYQYENRWQIVPGGDMDADDFPMWGWVWGTSDWITDEWVEEHIKELQDIGFTIIHHDEYGYFLGINGAGYDFYEKLMKSSPPLFVLHYFSPNSLNE